MACDTCAKCFIVIYLVAVIINLFEDTSYICTTEQFNLNLHMCAHTRFM